MATLVELVDDGVLEPYDAQLEADQLPVRYFYAAPQFLAWFNGILPTLPKDRGRDLSPLEQVDQLLHEFVKGDRMEYGRDCRKLRPLSHHVWELKTTDVRIFGWFPRRATYVALAGAAKTNLKPKSREDDPYQPFINATVAFRTKLPLDHPKYLTGGLPDVL